MNLCWPNFSSIYLFIYVGSVQLKVKSLHSETQSLSEAAACQLVRHVTCVSGILTFCSVKRTVTCIKIMTIALGRETSIKNQLKPTKTLEASLGHPN